VHAAAAGQVFPSRRTRIEGRIIGLAKLGQIGLDAGSVVVSLTPGDQRFPDSDGSFSFDNLPPGTYRLQASSPKYGFSAPAFTFQVEGNENELLSPQIFDFSQVSSLLFTDQPVGAFAPVQADPSQSDNKNWTYITQTHHTITNTYKFKDYWDKNGGVKIFGYPISEEFAEDGRIVQYFERSVFEYHSEAGTSNEIQLRLLGSQATVNRLEESAFKSIPAFTSSSTDFRQYFKETGHSLSNNFLNYWLSNNGQVIFGYPISEPFNEKESEGKTYLVQYFQRAKMEWHIDSNSVELSLLGRQGAQAQGVLGK
jgi:hypothetical protein